MAGGSDAAVSTLSCAQCGKPAHLQCPKCVELKLPREGAAFCTQDCFKSSWSSHKSVHLKAKLSALGLGSPGEQNSASPNDGWLYCLKKGQARTPKLPHFDWTGGSPKLSPTVIFSMLLRYTFIKTPEQIERMRETCRIAREVLDAAARVIRPGVTTDEIDDVVHEATIAAGGYPSPLNYHFFPKSCCTSVNEVICHGIPDARKLEDGDIVNVDVTVYYKGVHGDLNETFFVGNVDEASRQLVQCTYECLEKAIAIVWNFSPLRCVLRWAHNNDFKEWFWQVMKHGEVLSLGLFAAFCWGIWTRRNQTIFRDTHITAEDTVHMVCTLVNDFVHAQQRMQGQHRRVVDVQWSAPEDGWVKINFNGARFRDLQMVRVGAIIWNHSGEVMAALSEQFPFWVDANCVEAFAASKAIDLARELGFTDVQVEGDSLNIVKALCEGDEFLSGCGHILLLAVNSSRCFRRFQAIHVRKQGNELAHGLEKDFPIEVFSLTPCLAEGFGKEKEKVKPGVRFREIGEVINRHASMSGLSVVKSYCGHGIGELFHCAPNIPHYASILNKVSFGFVGNKAVGVMKAGQTFTIEPMINAGVWRDRMWPDGWTAVTADGKCSAQFEHTLLVTFFPLLILSASVTEMGVEVLTARLPSSPNVFPWLSS
ncbi:hypothetical protein HYC85_010978 [Camellia sinensis]|uniref:C6H2-type domain-containing protein n=1 Tax=Camellia sinensis TaxID=4442 RepID=A0A7J7HM22_CAMSI|nr:hypothetical protein HYC85_010978 [Camellia sinensis]